MPRVRFAVAGVPVEHSLSPLLMGLICEHLKKVSEMLPSERKEGVRPLARTSLPKIDRLDLVPVDKVEDALAWGYVGMYPGDLPDWNLVGSPLPAFRGKTLLERACTAITDSISESQVAPPPSQLSEESSAKVAAGNESEGVDGLEMTLDGGGPLPPPALMKIPGDHLENWLSITSPLKHQLSSGAVHFADDSKMIDSVNALLWNKREWWVASTDGIGLVMVAEHFGINIANGESGDGAILELHGGGGAARSCAAAWVNAGGRLRWTGGRRELAEGGPWSAGMIDEKKLGDAGLAAICIDFDVKAGELPSVKEIDTQADSTSKMIVLNSAYSELEGELESRFNQIHSTTKEGVYLDGRWLLCAQHLASWSMLWAPKLRPYLPSLGLLITRLINAEKHLKT